MAVASKKKKIFDGRYEVLAIVGRGAASVVYHARHAMTHSSEVALKVLLNQKGGTPSTDRLRKEALAMVSSRHKYVVRLDDFHSVQDLCYLSMEYAREGDLRKYVNKRDGTLSPDQALLFFTQTAEGLNFVHRVGITHRDIKPDNILVMNDREIRLADFGVAVLPGELASMEELRQGVGTMSYMAPEVLEGKACDKLSDIYALGVSFYEMITGVHPFENAPLIKQLEIREDQNVTPITELTPKISSALADVIMKCMRYDPSHRFQSVAELLKALGGNTSESTNAKPKREITPPTRVVRPDKGKVAPSVSAATRSTFSERQTKNKEAHHAKSQSARSTPTRATFSEKNSPPNRTSSRLQDKPPSQKPPANVQSKNKEPLPFDDTPFDFDEQVDEIDFDEITPIPEKKTDKELSPNLNIEEDQSELDDTISDSSHSEITREAPSEPPTIQPEKKIPSQPTPEPVEEPTFEDPDTLEEEVEVKASIKPERRDKPIRDKPSVLGGKSRPATSWLPMIVTIILVAYAGKYILSKLSNLNFFSSSSESISTTASSDVFIPLVSEPVETFPNLPAGMYNGTITGVTPGTTHPLTIISFPQNRSLAFIVGLEGWTPNIISLDKYDKQNQKDGPKKIRIASNGMVLDLVGEVQEGNLVGSFLNAVSGEKGKWSASPVAINREDK